MATKENTVLLKIGANTDAIKEASSELARLQKAFNSARKQFDVGLSIGLADRALSAISSIPAKLKASLDAYAVQEGAERSLAAAMKATGNYSKENLDSFKNFASELQRITTVGDETVMGMQNLALNMGVNKDQMERCMRGAIGLSKAFGMDLNLATKASAAALQGKTELLTRYIPTLSMCKTQEEKLAKVQEYMNKGFAQAQDEVNELQGMFKQLSNALGDLSEVFGESIAPAAKVVISLLKTLSEMFSENKNFTILATRALLSLFAAIAINKLSAFITEVKRSTAATIKDTIAIKANTVAKTENAVASKAQGAATAVSAAGALKASVSFTAAAGALRGLSVAAAGLALKALPFIAIAAAVGGLMYKINELNEAYGRLDNLTKKFQNDLDSDSEKTISKIEAEKRALNEKGATQEELTEQIRRYRVQLELANGTLKTAKDAGLNTKEAENQVSAIKSHIYELEAAAEYFEQTRRKYDWQNNERASNLKSDYERKVTPLSETQKLEELNASLLKKKQEIYTLEKDIASATGEEKKELVDKYEIELAALIKVQEEQRKQKEKVDEIAKSAKEKVEAEKAAATAAERKVIEAEEALRLEEKILQAKLSGNKEDETRLEAQKRVSELAKSYVDARKSDKMTAEQLNRLEQNGLKFARERVDLENQVNAATKERERLKQRESTVEEYIWRLKIAQAKAAGDEALVKALENARDTAREIESIVESGIMSRAEAEALVNSVREAEKNADEKESERNSNSGGSGSSRGGKSGRVSTGNINADARANIRDRRAASRRPKLSRLSGETDEELEARTKAHYEQRQKKRDAAKNKSPKSLDAKSAYDEVKGETKEATNAMDKRAAERKSGGTQPQSVNKSVSDINKEVKKLNTGIKDMLSRLSSIDNVQKSNSNY